jgi:hypothetical protein
MHPAGASSELLDAVPVVRVSQEPSLRYGVALILIGIVLTMSDFAIDVRTRGTTGIAAGERITHGMMAIVYGAMLGRLAPHVYRWSERATSFGSLDGPVPSSLRTLVLCMAVGVFCPAFATPTPRSTECSTSRWRVARSKDFCWPPWDSRAN